MLFLLPHPLLHLICPRQLPIYSSNNRLNLSFVVCINACSASGFFQLVKCILYHSFLLLNIVSLFLLLSVERFFSFVTIMNKLDMNIYVQVFCIPILFLDKYLGMELLGHMVHSHCHTLLYCALTPYL